MSAPNSTLRRRHTPELDPHNPPPRLTRRDKRRAGAVAAQLAPTRVRMGRLPPAPLEGWALPRRLVAGRRATGAYAHVRHCGAAGLRPGRPCEVDASRAGWWPGGAPRTALWRCWPSPRPRWTPAPRNRAGGAAPEHPRRVRLRRGVRYACQDGTACQGRPPFSTSPTCPPPEPRRSLERIGHAPMTRPHPAHCRRPTAGVPSCSLCHPH